jgi:soluble lytic murein transglycosylase
MARARGKFQRWRRRLLLALLVLAGAAAFLDWRWFKREHRHDSVILAAALRQGVDPALVKAVVWRESRFDARAVGRAGEIGLMQITEPTALEWAGEESVTNFEHALLFDPAMNTRCGVWYLAKLLRRYPRADDPLPFALADYNAGRGNVLRWAKGAAATNSAAFIAAIGFPGTQDYVQSIAARRSYYTNDFPRRK